MSEVLKRASMAVGQNVTLIYRSQSLTGRLEGIEDGVLVLRQNHWRELRVPVDGVKTFSVHRTREDRPI